MNNIRTTFWSIIIACVALAACNNEKKEEKPVNEIAVSQAPSNEALRNFVEGKYLKKIDKTLYQTFEADKYIAALHTDLYSEIYILKDFAGTWQEEAVLSAEEFIEMSFEKIESGNYLYYCYVSAGNTLGSVNFVLFDLKTKKEYSLEFMGPIGQYSTLVDIEPDLEAKPALLGFLKNKAEKSRLVTKEPISENQDEDESNYYKDWRISNENIYDRLSANPGKWFAITTKEYTKNILGELDEGNIAHKIKLGKYVITSVFKGDVIAYDTKSRKYIPIWLPPDAYEWIDNLSIENGNIILSKGEEKLFELNIHEMKIRALIK